MIKFFRKIRQKLLVENRFNKYLLYAIGEIVLVVIGILIALQINIWNQEKNNDKKVVRILSQVQKDLLNDIQEAQYISDWYEKNDKMLNEFLKGTKDKDYFKENAFEFFKIGRQTYSFSQSKQAFNRLNDQLDILPQKFDDVLNKLNRLYGERSYFLDQAQTLSEDVILEYRKELFDNFNGIEKMSGTDISDEIFTYIYSSKKHRRHLVKHQSFLSVYFAHIKEIKEQSLLSYLIIKDIINDDSELPEIIKGFGLDYANNTIDEFTGSYYFRKDTTNIGIMEKKHNILFWTQPNEREIYSEGYMLREYGKDSLGFVFSNTYPFKFIRDSIHKVVGFKGYDVLDSTNTVQAIKMDND
jgi:hypothetical protein